MTGALPTGQSWFWYLSSQHASPARPPEAPGWPCGRHCCPSGSAVRPGKGTCSQSPGLEPVTGVQTGAVCHLESAGSRQEPAGLWLWQFSLLRKEMERMRHQTKSLSLLTSNFILTPVHNPCSSLPLLDSANICSHLPHHNGGPLKGLLAHPSYLSNSQAVSL